jgi:hypothetical protein
MECLRVPVSCGLLEILFVRMDDGKEWCPPELSGGKQPLKCTDRSELQKRLKHPLPAPWTTTVPLKDVLPLLTETEKDRLNMSSQRLVRGSLFLVSMEAFSELLHHTSRTSRVPPPPQTCAGVCR